jgi:hypothetical protein
MDTGLLRYARCDAYISTEAAQRKEDSQRKAAARGWRFDYWWLMGSAEVGDDGCHLGAYGLSSGKIVLL